MTAVKCTHSRLSFIPFTTYIDPVFWNEVNRLKLNEWQLDESPKPLHAIFTIHGAQPSDSLICLEQDSFIQKQIAGANIHSETGQCSIKGTFHLLNTKKSFMEMDRRKMLENFAESLWTIIGTKQWLEQPNLLNFFYLTAFADVKNYTYFFWNCIPALQFPDNIRQRKLEESEESSLFIISAELHSLIFDYSSKNDHQPFLLVDEKPTKLTELATLNSPNQFIFVFPNPSEMQSKFGWPLRNLLAAIAHLRPDWTSLRILALTRLREHSFTAIIEWDKLQEDFDNRTPKCAGWERTSDDKLTFRSVNLRFMFDPIKIMEQTVDLNLKLIRWRQAPSINLDKFTNLRVLLIGSGTLGCNISRALLGWGVRQFTFIDFATVSYNNPIRQSLFCFDDCQTGDNPKAIAAANALKRIYPLVDAKGFHMKVPMPGYPYNDEETNHIKEQCRQLEECIRECDVLFLVMDSRESRWLPTLLAAVHNKLALTVALGFDDFVIIRHGANPQKEEQESTTTSDLSIPSTSGISRELPGSLLGCYFCNDVTAPGNSTSDRALDQQCTISRSGISMIASGLATELLASLLQHPLGAEAPARIGNAEPDEFATVLGAVPHQIRAFLSRFHQITPTIQRFNRCTACGQKVQQLYREQGFAFLDRIFKEPTELERLTGLTELQEQANEFQEAMIELDDNISVSSA